MRRRGRMLWVLVALMVAGGMVSARTLDYATLHAMPKSTEKDYYLWRYLSSSRCTKTEAKKLIREARRINGKLAKAYRKKTGHRPPNRTRKSHAKPSPKAIAAQKKKHEQTLALLKSPHPLTEWRKLDPAMQVYVLNHAGTDGRRRLDTRLSAQEFARLSTQWGFNTAIRRILKEKHPKLSASLLQKPPKKHHLSIATQMRLGFYALTHHQKHIAEKWFANAARTSPQRDAADRALFWAYMSDKNRDYLQKLTHSYDLNLYTLLARDFLHLKYPATITPSLPKARLMRQSTLSDPIHWARLKQKIFDKKTDLTRLAKGYHSAESIGYYTYIMAKASRETKHYFPMPYRDWMKRLPVTRQAMLYAIARQESRFVPASVSTSYALGMMQIMPFLVRHLAKQLGEKVDYDAMFDPRTALRYANKHLDYLTHWLQHPLYIAYAYNAGIGYTRRMLRRKDLFRGKGAYEPYLSLERVDNEQANTYGKRVLVNYVIYLNKLGTPIRLKELLGVLHRPEITDKFRKRK